MSTLNDKIRNSIIALHFKTSKEWIPLNEIYSEVENTNADGKNVGAAAIRDAIEKHCKLSTKFSSPEEYILKEKLSGLYKYIYYDQIKFINNLNIGDVFTRDQLMAIFKISGQSGIMKTNSLNCLVLTTSESNGIYDDSTVLNGVITYTGEGLTGDQTISKNNKTIFESNDNKIPMYLFSKDKNRKYIFEGKVKLNDEPYQSQEKDIDGNERIVWKFPLCIVYPDNYDFDNDDKFKQITYEIKEIENKIYPEMVSEQKKLQFIDGIVNIRKYRKNDKKIQRSIKPDYVADEIVKSMQGVVNERKIYEQELGRLMTEEAKEQVQLMEDFFENKKENEGFDILSFELNNDGEYVEKYIEVKSTKNGEGTPIDITSDEINFAQNHINNYYLYRIFNSDSNNPQYKIILGKDLLNQETYNFVPTTFKIFLN